MESWTFTSRASNGETDENKRTCTVVGTEIAATRGGPQKAYKIVCDSRWAEQLYYIGADGREIRSVKIHKKRGTESDLETIRVELPTS
jgi:hypothetical protein